MGLRKFFKLIGTLGFAFSLSANADSTNTTTPMSFKIWKDQQIIELQNQVARLNNQIVLLKSGKLRPEEVALDVPRPTDLASDSEIPTSRARKKTSTDVLPRLEKELARTQKSLDFARDVGLQEYFLGYLSQFQENPAALASVAQLLSKEEVTELLKVLLKASNPLETSSTNPY